MLEGWSISTETSAEATIWIGSLSLSFDGYGSLGLLTVAVESRVPAASTGMSKPTVTAGVVSPAGREAVLVHATSLPVTEHDQPGPVAETFWNVESTVSSPRLVPVEAVLPTFSTSIRKLERLPALTSAGSCDLMTSRSIFSSEYSVRTALSVRRSGA